MDICRVRHSSDLFHVHEQSLSVEISTLEANHNEGEVLGQVYDDACDEGFIIVSKKTGRDAVFAINETVKDSEGDVRYWTMVPTRDTVRRLPQLKGWEVMVFND